MDKDSKLWLDVNKARVLRDEVRSIEASIAHRLTQKPITRADEAAMDDMQVRADAVYQALGMY